jgi:GT2 family glycosyltransferase
MLARREFIERVGLFDDRFFAYCEEIDWCLRGRRAGYRLGVVPDSVIWHRGHRTSGLLGRRFIGYLLARNHLLLLRKHSGSFVAGGGPALVYFAASTLWRILAGVAAWGATGDPRRLEEAEGMVRGIGDFWRGRFGRPPKGL